MSGNDDGGRAMSTAGIESSSSNAMTAPVQPMSLSAPGSLIPDSALSGNLFDPMYSLLPSSVTQAEISPLELEAVNPFDFPLDPALTISDASLGYLDGMNVDLTAGAADDVFQVEDWSRYMWSPETGFEHLDTGLPSVTQ